MRATTFFRLVGRSLQRSLEDTDAVLAGLRTATDAGLGRGNIRGLLGAMESEALSSGANSIRIVGHVVSKCGGGGGREVGGPVQYDRRSQF